MSRAEAVAHLQALGVPFGESGDVAELKRSIVEATESAPLRIFSAEKQCAKKIRYVTYAAAHKALRKIGNPFVRPYLCLHCGRGWHNGNPPKSRGVR